MSARDAVIVDAVRTPVGKRNGSLARFHAVDLSAHVLNALVARNGFDPAVVDDVIWGCVQQVGQQAGNVGRMAVLAAGWPESVAGTTVDRQRGSSQQTIHFAPVELPDGQVLSADEGLRRGTSAEKLAELKPAFKEGGVIHAGSSSQISDGAAAV